MDLDPMAKVAHRTRRGRRSKRYPNICLSQLAREVGVGVPHISKVMRGIKNPSLALAKRISAALGVSLDTLVEQIGRQECQNQK